MDKKDHVRCAEDSFTRVPMIEDCYPYNLLQSIFPQDEDNPEESIPSIWLVDIPGLKNRITAMTDREQRILELRYQFGLTLDEAAAVFGLTRERIRQIQVKAERRLKHWVLHCGGLMTTYAEHMTLVAEFNRLNAENEKLKIQGGCGESKSNMPRQPEEDDSAFNSLMNLDGLSARAYNCLMLAGIKSVYDILKFDANQGTKIPESWGFRNNNWLKIRNLGRRTLREIATLVDKFCGYRIRYYNEKTCSFTKIPIEGEENNAVPS